MCYSCPSMEAEDAHPLHKSHCIRLHSFYQAFVALQVIEFDGSTEIGQCLSSLCIKLKLRPALLSGYALYANDPSGSDEDLVLLKGKQKVRSRFNLNAYGQFLALRLPHRLGATSEGRETRPGYRRQLFYPAAAPDATSLDRCVALLNCSK